MLKQISWATFLAFTMVISTIYYVAILSIYYKSLFLKTVLSKLKFIASGEDNKAFSRQDLSPEDSQVVNGLLNEIEMCIQQAGTNKSQSEELLFGLRNIISTLHLPSSNKEEVKKNINNFIKTTSQKICSIRLSEEDLCMLWV